MSQKNQKMTALYVRVSTQNQGSGMDSQARALRNYCAQNGITNFVVYEDEGISGAKESRPALNRMMQDVEEGRIDRVCVYSFSRYARSTTHMLRALETFKAKNVSFVSLTEKIDTNTPLGYAFFTVVSAISQLEKDLIRDRVINGLKAAKERGVQIGRKKTRPSQLIRRLRKSGLTYREVAKIAGISQGAVAAEMRAWDKEKRLGIELPMADDLPANEILKTEKTESPLPAPIPETEAVPPEKLLST